MIIKCCDPKIKLMTMHRDISLWGIYIPVTGQHTNLGSCWETVSLIGNFLIILIWSYALLKAIQFIDEHGDHELMQFIKYGLHETSSQQSCQCACLEASSGAA